MEQEKRITNAEITGEIHRVARALGQAMGLLGADLSLGEPPYKGPFTPQPTREQADAFLADLAELTRKHGIAVVGYECWLDFVPADERDGAYGYDYEEWRLESNDSPIQEVWWRPPNE